MHNATASWFKGLAPGSISRPSVSSSLQYSLVSTEHSSRDCHWSCRCNVKHNLPSDSEQESYAQLVLHTANPTQDVRVPWRVSVANGRYRRYRQYQSRPPADRVGIAISSSTTSRVDLFTQAHRIDVISVHASDRVGGCWQAAAVSSAKGDVCTSSPGARWILNGNRKYVVGREP